MVQGKRGGALRLVKGEGRSRVKIEENSRNIEKDVFSLASSSKINNGSVDSANT